MNKSPHHDFSQLLKEAERNIDRSKTEEDSRDETMKKKTVWKSFVLRLWKGEKNKKKNENEGNDETTSRHHRALRRRFMSGPVRAFSGPVISGLFSPIRKEGKGNNTQIPYVCLDDQNDIINYGPLYLVT